MQKLHDQIIADNEFFRVEDERPMVLAGKITRRLKPTKVAKGRKNMFITVAPQFFYPCLFLIEDYKNVTRFANLLAKGLYTLAVILDSAQNHWQIEQFSQEAFALFQRVKHLSSRVAKSSDNALLQEEDLHAIDFSSGDLESASLAMQEKGQNMTNEDARTRWEQITMNLAFMLAKIKIMNSEQGAEAAEWLDEQIEAAGGKQELQQVCRYVLAQLTN